MKILIVEDEIHLADSMVRYLSNESYRCEVAYNYAEAIDKISYHTYDCILLDIMLPDGSGMQLLQELKKEPRDEGIIIISAKDALDDRIEGLHIGADDYLTKPFHLPELAARIFSIIRRKQFQNTNIVHQDGLHIDLLAKTVRYNDTPITLTKKEFDLLLFFFGNKHKVISKNTLAEHLSGDFADMLDNYDFVYAHVKNLKKKLAEAGTPSFLKTIYGSGYKWEA
ncbi:response regulator transcription factor [Sphingobacterium psychroaquaticum]|nr:response regulator transcription factor [Sphingobacterium psychroaquaticum]QBQ43034.1 response regulator transcription factor [Sphingobacterium psychroaquaticum]